MHGHSAQAQLSPRDVARWQKAQEQLLGRRFKDALGAYRALVNRFPSLAELWFELGNAASGELDFAQANAAYRRALALAPDNASLLSMIGQQYQGLRQMHDARHCFERAVAASPDSVDARISLAVWFEKERRLAEALEQVQACLAWHPNQARFYETARQKVLYAPTYHDVTQPVYQRAVGRWHRYAAALAPFQARLAPYCKMFGYEA